MNQMNKNIGAEDSDQISPGDLLYKFLPYWPLFTVLLLVSLTGTWIYLRYKIPVYRTTATLLIKDDKKNAANSDLLDALDIFGSKKNVENEVEVLQSKTLMQEVVQNLHLYAPVIVEGRVMNQSGYTTSPIVIEAKMPDSFKPTERIEFKFNERTNQVIINNKNYSLNQWLNMPFGVIKFLHNKNYQRASKSDNGNDFYFSLINVKKVANSILGQLNVTSSSKQSTVINLNIENEIPRRGEDILNELLDVYDRAAILDKNILAANTLNFVEDRLKYVVNELDSVENRLQTFKSSNQITDISTQGQIFLQTVSVNDQKLSDINMQLAVLDQVERYVKEKGGLGGLVPATLGVPDPALTDLLEKLAALELQYTQTKNIVPENNPVLVSLVDGINKLKPGILDNIQSQKRNLLAGKKDLINTNSHYSSMLKSIPEKEKELLEISRQQGIKNNIYTFLLQKKEETAMSFASAVADSRIIDRAESSDIPVSPKKRLIYLASVLAALVVGVGLVYAREMLSRTVQGRDEIEKITNVPVLGEVMYDRSKSSLVIAEGKRSFIAEQFRQLRTALSYLGIDESHKRILVTSSISGEGKSFIATNLAISLSLMGKKVVLIELDLRKPKLSEQFGISRATGLSNYLIGKLASAELLKPTGMENFFLIASGPIPPNPSELIANGKIVELFKYLEGIFDFIIVDTAPVNPVTDAFILSPFCDVTLFVIRQDYTPKMFIKNLEQQHKKNALKNAAIIYNGVKSEGLGRYGYGYGYGYGYTEEDKKVGKWWRFFSK